MKFLQLNYPLKSPFDIILCFSDFQFHALNIFWIFKYWVTLFTSYFLNSKKCACYNHFDMFCRYLKQCPCFHLLFDTFCELASEVFHQPVEISHSLYIIFWASSYRDKLQVSVLFRAVQDVPEVRPVTTFHDIPLKVWIITYSVDPYKARDLRPSSDMSPT